MVSVVTGVTVRIWLISEIDFMLKIRLILVGKSREKYCQLAEQEFIQRIRKYAGLELVIVRGEKINSPKSAMQVQKIEADRIEKQLEKGEYKVVLVKEGKQVCSEEFAQFLQTLSLKGVSRICFIVGGPLGLSDEFIQRCDFQLSFSKMTFTHEMIRILLLEQIYRAFTILNQEKYHK